MDSDQRCECEHCTAKISLGSGARTCDLCELDASVDPRCGTHGLTRRVRTRTPLHGKCECGGWLEFVRAGYGEDFECRCGRAYNSAGQRVAYAWSFKTRLPPPEFDGTDAGETWGGETER